VVWSSLCFLAKSTLQRACEHLREAMLMEEMLALRRVTFYASRLRTNAAQRVGD
jgi:hypothetical protein